MEWLFNHPDDTGEDDAAPTAGPPTPAAIPEFTAIPACFKLKAFISHKGPLVHSGHYIAHIWVNSQWLFNDEKVVKADDESMKELKKLVYLYFFERV